MPVSSLAFPVERASDAARRADILQADYYRQLLLPKRKHVEHQLATAEAQLAKIRLTGNSGTARRLLWTTRELRRERNELHCLLIALDYRFPDSGITRPL
jgi:hypothetical protein